MGATTSDRIRTTRCSISSGPNGNSALGRPMRLLLPPQRTMPAADGFKVRGSKFKVEFWRAVEEWVSSVYFHDNTISLLKSAIRDRLMSLRLSLKARSSVPLEVEGITPD